MLCHIEAAGQADHLHAIRKILYDPDKGGTTHLYDAKTSNYEETT